MSTATKGLISIICPFASNKTIEHHNRETQQEKMKN